MCFGPIALCKLRRAEFIRLYICKGRTSSALRVRGRHECASVPSLSVSHVGPNLFGYISAKAEQVQPYGAAMQMLRFHCRQGQDQSATSPACCTSSSNGCG